VVAAIYGPSCPPQARSQGSAEIVLLKREPLLVVAETLAEALAAYTGQYGVRFRPYDGSDPRVPFQRGEPPKYFLYDTPDGRSILVDIHIQRGSESICPKQDLSVHLEPNDEVHIGPLAC
jgi:hypothetical protein